MDWSRGFQVFSSATHDGLWLDEGVEELRLEKTVTSPQKTQEEIDKLTLDENMPPVERAVVLLNIVTTNQREFYIINNIEVTDAGSLVVQYFEQVDTDAVDLGSLTTNISVIDPAHLTSVNGPQRVLTGRPVTLTCNIAAIPNATVTWYKDGSLVPSGTSISTTPDTNTQLTIASATPADSGMYQCVVSNQHGDDIGSISLQVRDPQLELVQSLDRETPFLAGDNQTLMVIVRSDTVPTVTWSVNGQQLTSSNSTYTIGSPAAGTVIDGVLTEYTISFSVFFLNTTYQGEYRVVVEVPSDGLSVETTGNVLQERLTSNVIVEEVDSPCLVVGTNVTLRCQPDGVPRSQVTWFRNVQPLSSNSKYRISDYPDFTLTITDVDSSDAGSYTCTAENTLTNGTSSGTIAETFYMFTTTCVTPTILESPNDPVNNNPMLTAGEALTLTCSATGSPRPEIQWYQEDSIIISSAQIQITDINSDETTVVSMLIISSITVGDSGTYECRVENMAGTASREYSVSVAIDEIDGGSVILGGVIAGGVVAGSVAILIIIVGVVITVLTVLCCNRRKPIVVTGSVKSKEEGEEMVQATLDHETVYDTIDEYEMASLSCRAELMRGGGGDCIDPAPEGEGPPTRELEEEEEGKKMQANPAYLSIEISHKIPEEEEYADKAGPEGERQPTREETEGGGM